MEKQESIQEQGTAKKKIIKASDIYCGVVSLIKIVDNSDLETMDEEAIVLDKSSTKKVVALDIRKIAIAKEWFAGTDLFYKLHRSEKYEYQIMDLNDLRNNSIVIRDPRCLGSVLSYAGYRGTMDNGDLREIKKILMSRDEILRVTSHNVRLTPEGVINSSQVAGINDQAVSLLEFRALDLPIKPQKIEKVYAKYFK